MSENKNYAYLPEDLIIQMLSNASNTAEKLANTINLNENELSQSREILEKNMLICHCLNDEYTDSIMAVDGANIIDHKTSADVMLSIAVGVDGLSGNHSQSWPIASKQYQQWQTALPHHVANTRLSQGIMFLMELSILSEANREIRIMDGSHLTTILKLNSLLSANDHDNADMPYVDALSSFLKENYNKVIPDIPDIINNAFSEPSIIGLTKYSSSREIIDSVLKNLNIHADDKVFMSSLLKENEYTKPLPVGQTKKNKAIWKQIHIACNLNIDGVNNVEFNHQLSLAILPFKITNNQKPNLFFCYYKPFEYAPAYRIEIKKSLAEDKSELEKTLSSIRRQIVMPEIREPYPQYLADIVAKNISFGMQAVNQAIYSNPILNSEKNFDLIFPYRTS